MICDRELKEMSGNTFVTKGRPRIFNRGANVKIFRFRFVSWNEIETGGIFVVNAGWIHEAARAGWLKSFGQLPNLKRAEIIRQRHEIMLLQEADHFCLAAFVRF